MSNKAKIDTTKNFHFVFMLEDGKYSFYHDGVLLSPEHTEDFSLQCFHKKYVRLSKWQMFKNGISYSFKSLKGYKDDE